MKNLVMFDIKIESNRKTRGRKLDEKLTKKIRRILVNQIITNV
jgi:hypothetical protein